MNKQKLIIKTAQEELDKEEFQNQVDRVKIILKELKKATDKVSRCEEWIRLYKEKKNPKLDGDILNAEDFNSLK